MTKLPKTLDRIREVCWLNYFDCHYFKGDNPKCSHFGATEQEEYDGVKCTKIVSHPIHLEHLLFAIGKDEADLPNGCACFSCHTPKWKVIYTDIISYFDLTKSVEQNLASNEELLNLVAELLGVE